MADNKPSVKGEDWNAMPDWMKEDICELVEVAAFLSVSNPTLYQEILRRVREQ